MSEEPVPLPWERQLIDTNESWQAFVLYRDMPPPRKTRRVFGPTVLNVAKWYSEHAWEKRVAAYDAHLDKIRREERERIMAQSARDVAVEHMALLADARDVVSHELSLLANQAREQRVAGFIKPGDLIKLAEMTMKFDRLVRGETTENVGTGELDLSKLSDDEFDRYQELVAKMRAEESGPG